MSVIADIRRAIFARPYRGLPAFIFAFFVLCFALHPFSPLFTHHLADPDDYMRLQQVADLLQGHGWYNLSVPRMGADTIVHWSRLIDLPIATIALPFIPAMGIHDALLISSFITPLLWFAILLALLPRLASFGVGADRANIACVMVLFAPMLLFNYTPGRVDHHGVQAIIAGFGLLSLCQIIVQHNARFYAIASALCFACGFWIGAEALPWAILFITCLGFVAAWQGGMTARCAAIFGVALPIFTILLLPVALPASEFSSRALSWFSPAYALFALLGGGVLIAGYFLSRILYQRSLRLVLYALLGLAALACFFALIPSALNGPFTDYNNFDATLALENITEAMPLSQAFHINRFMPVTFIPAVLVFLRLLLLPIIAIFTCLRMAYRNSRPLRFVWLTQFVFLFAATALTLFWQNRVGIFMELFTIAPLTCLLCQWWEKLKFRLWDRSLFWGEIGVFLCLGFLPVILIPALVHKTPLYPDILMFPAARGAAQCPLEPIMGFLNETDGLGATSLTILNNGDTGPQILFDTHHKVIAGNFDVPANADVFAFFNAIDDNAAYQTAIKTHADIVLLCRIPSTLYLGKDYYNPAHMGIETGNDGLLHFTNNNPHQPLIQRLIRGQPPAWLKKIEIPVPSDYLIFRIKPLPSTP